MALKGLHRISKGPEIEMDKKIEWKRYYRRRPNSSFRWLYEGQMINNIMNGFGVLTKVYKNGFVTKIYSGHWKNGKRHGFGGLWYENGNYYEGNFSQGCRQGFGRLWQVGGQIYQGFWHNDLYHGEGMLVQSNKSRYEGEFKNGLKDGLGLFYHLETGRVQEGAWEMDSCKMSTIKDLYFRQSTTKPTPYPIPKLDQYVNRDEVAKTCLPVLVPL